MTDSYRPGGAEESYFEGLLRDFGTAEAPSAREALKRVFERYSALQDGHAGVAERLLLQEEYPFRAQLRALSSILHEFLYDGILTNAGNHRKASEPNFGRVEFGGQRGQRGRSRYRGTTPHKIETELDKAFNHLAARPSESSDPAREAMLFYAEFVAVHPFYDANGRIGRLLVSMYLYACGYHVDWTALDEKQNKFLGKLNACHDRRTSKNRAKYHRYQRFLVNFFKRYVTPLDDFYSPDVE